GSARVSYQLDEEDKYRAFAGVSQAFRAPGLSDLSRLDGARTNEQEVPSPDLEPEKFLTYEVGLKANLGNFRGQVSYFYNDVSDLIQRSPNGNVLPSGDLEVVKFNSGQGYIQGVELDFNYLLTEQVELFGGFAYQDSSVSTFPTSAPVLVDEYVTRTLPTNGYFGARWESIDESLWFEGIVRIVDTADRLNTRDSRDTSRIPPGGTPGYTLTTLRSGWQVNDNVLITSGIENIFDQAYRAHGSGQNEPGLNFYLGAEVKF
ncbi:MAG: TonB-dependent receptor, partial [Verrucomicrobiota bacterium]